MFFFCFPQHAPPDVTKILVGNKCDMDSVRAVPTMRAVNVSICCINRLHQTLPVLISQTRVTCFSSSKCEQKKKV